MVNGRAKSAPGQGKAYSYKIKDEKGKLIKGELHAQSLNEAIRLLEKSSCSILYLEKIPTLPPHLSREFTVEEVMHFFRELSVMLGCGISLQKALAILTEHQSTTRDFFLELAASISRGNSFSDSMKACADVFSRYHVSLVRAGEAGGFLDKSLETLTSVIEKEIALRKQMQAALTYPFMIFFFGIAITLGAFYFVFPYLKILVSDLGVKLPFSSKIIMTITDWIGRPYVALPLIGAIIYGIVVARKAFLYNVSGSVEREKLLLSVPVISEIVKKAIIIRTFSVMEALLNSGVNIIHTLEHAADGSGSIVVEDVFLAVADRVKYGEGLSKSFAEYPSLFPRAVVNMVAAGEESGELPEMLRKIVSLYSVELTSAIESFMKLLEPLAILSMGIFIGAIILSFFVPVYMSLSRI
ncbi:MAG: type II secretion system F family protein [Candidatus Eremiobacteraeota bacterium]|nr:type II secretion system F family protein [Candidatus Eremiobacteraeota bacterium]